MEWVLNRGTEPNGHCVIARNAVGHGVGTEWAQTGHKAKGHPGGWPSLRS